MKTTITLTIEHKKPISDLLDKVAGRAYTLDGVDDVTASVVDGRLIDIDALCANIKAADDASADMDYMIDSNDCISVLRGTWRGPLLNDHPAPPAP